MSMKRILILLFVFGILLSGCTQSEPASSTESTSPSEAPPSTPETVPFTTPSTPTDEPASPEEPLPLGPGPVVSQEPETPPAQEPSIACIDAEEGKVTYNGKDYADYCISNTVIYEYYCENDVLKQKQVVCAESEVCKNAVCVEGEEHECTDTDGGKSLHTKGTVTYWSGGEEYTETDKCYDSYSVLEVWCTAENTVGFGIMECPDSEVCEDGRCTDD